MINNFFRKKENIIKYFSDFNNFRDFIFKIGISAFIIGFIFQVHKLDFGYGFKISFFSINQLINDAIILSIYWLIFILPILGITLVFNKYHNIKNIINKIILYTFFIIFGFIIFGYNPYKNILVEFEEKGIKYFLPLEYMNDKILIVNKGIVITYKNVNGFYKNNKK